MQLEDLGFCKKGEGGRFVADGNLISGVGRLPVNTDGGGLCNNHPANRGGMTKVIEAVRQLRGEAHPQVQVKSCDLALAHGTGGLLGSRHAQRNADPGAGMSAAVLIRRPVRSIGRSGKPPARGGSSSGVPVVRQAHWYPRALCPFCLAPRSSGAKRRARRRSIATA